MNNPWNEPIPTLVQLVQRNVAGNYLHTHNELRYMALAMREQTDPYSLYRSPLYVATYDAIQAECIGWASR